MPNKLYFQERLTHTYSDGWQQLGPWGEGGTFHILSSSVPIYYDESYYESWDIHMRIKAPVGMSHDLVERILHSAFRSSCRYGHDCHGHISAWAWSVKRIKRREWRVRVSITTLFDQLSGERSDHELRSLRELRVQQRAPHL